MNIPHRRVCSVLRPSPNEVNEAAAAVQSAPTRPLHANRPLMPFISGVMEPRLGSLASDGLSVR